MCGIVGVFPFEYEKSLETSNYAKGLGEGLKNRGKEGCGISLYTGERYFIIRRGISTVSKSISQEWLNEYPSFSAIVQTRYSTTGSGAKKADREKTINIHDKKYTRNFQPFEVDTLTHGQIALVHNGNLSCISKPKAFLDERGIVCSSETDTEIILKLIAYFLDVEKLEIVEAIQATMRICVATFSCILQTNDSLYAFRDIYANRPLKIAKTDTHYFFVSESRAWHKYKAKYVGSLDSGQIVKVSEKGLEYFDWPFEKLENLQKCVMESIYMMSPSTHLTSESNKAAGHRTVSHYRKKGGRDLFRLHPLPPGIVIPIKESGKYYALGYQFEHGKANPGLSFYDDPFPKDDDDEIGRSFMEPDEEDRIRIADIKNFNLFDGTINAIEYIIQECGECWLILCDDSLIRCITSERFILRLRKILAEFFPPEILKKIKIAWLIGSPPYRSPCYYGIDTPTDGELVASRFPYDTPIAEIEGYVKVRIHTDYAGYIDIETFRKRLGPMHGNFCMTCFTGDYIIPVDPGRAKMSLAK